MGVAGALPWRGLIPADLRLLGQVGPQPREQSPQPVPHPKQCFGVVVHVFSDDYRLEVSVASVTAALVVARARRRASAQAS